MSEFELTYLMVEFLDALQSRITLFMTGLFAMLAAAHFVAPRLDRAMSIAVLSLFTLYSLIIGLDIYRTGVVVDALGEKIVDQYAEQLTWLISGPAYSLTVPLTILLIGAHGSAIWFFVYRRGLHGPRM